MTHPQKESDNLTGRELLLVVATRLFSEHGYDGVSMQDIATASDMTKGSPYYHYKSKQDLFIQAYQINITRMQQEFLASLASGESLREKLIAAFTNMLVGYDPGMIRMWDDYLRLFVQTGAVETSEQKELPQVIRSAYQQAFEESGEDLRFPPDLIAEALMALELGTLHFRVVHPLAPERSLAAEDATRVATDLIDVFLNGAIRRDH